MASQETGRVRTGPGQEAGCTPSGPRATGSPRHYRVPKTLQITVFRAQCPSQPSRKNHLKLVFSQVKEKGSESSNNIWGCPLFLAQVLGDPNVSPVTKFPPRYALSLYILWHHLPHDSEHTRGPRAQQRMVWDLRCRNE